ncbi:MAG: NAD(P)-dependent oxidoreductase [Tepidisphaeraceae bacterium]
MSDRPTILVTEGSDARPLAWLTERASVIEVAHDSPDLDRHLPGADGLVVRTYTRVNESMLDKCARLKVIGRGGVGLENIDLAACRRRGVRVVHTPNANTNAVGDFVFGVLLRLIRGWDFFHDRSYDMREFKRVRDHIRGRQLDELTLGILGMGRVGRRVGQIAALGFGMRVLYNDLVDVSAHVKFPATSVDTPTLYRESDVLSIHVDMRAGNENLVSARELSMMKPTAILLNTSRGEVLDAVALAQALREKRLAAAALDVFNPEPPPVDFPLLGMDNVLLTPHLASRTHTATENMSWVVKDVMAVLEGKEPTWPAWR